MGKMLRNKLQWFKYFKNVSFDDDLKKTKRAVYAPLFRVVG